MMNPEIRQTYLVIKQIRMCFYTEFEYLGTISHQLQGGIGDTGRENKLMLRVWRATILDSSLVCLKEKNHNGEQWHLVQIETVAKKKGETCLLF